jgi:coniferyl-aldehyde dehydrogenase
MALDDGGPDISLSDLLNEQRSAFMAEPYPTLAVRRERLARLEALIEDEHEALIEAVDADFGNRPRQETELAELFLVRSEIRHLSRRLRKWMAPKRVPTTIPWLPGRGYVQRQPLGVIGILSPWNYPIQLSLIPVAVAIAAGNRVMLKPSEAVPRTAALLSDALARAFPTDLVAVVQGDAAVAERFTRLTFDHLFFTGSTAVGRRVAAAAAENLVPVTLELGGKSPVIIDPDADVAEAAVRIAQGKLLNAGQTCIAPDYALVHTAQLDAFISAYVAAVQTMHPVGRKDLASIVGTERRRRLIQMIEEARTAGATIVNARSSSSNAPETLDPVVVVDPDPSTRLMQEEIFGPILPVVPYADREHAIAFVTNRPRPLALYWFGRNVRQRDELLRTTHAGGVTINGTLWHMAQAELPFGGIGHSGFGAYHGETGFRRLSHEKAVFIERRITGTRLLRPPYGRLFDLVIRLLRWNT